MADLKLTFAMTPYDRVLPLISGEVKPDGITLEYMGMPGGVPRVFYDQLKFNRYDLSEMSMSSHLRQRSVGWPYRMLPVFHNRIFSYAMIQIRRESGIRQGHPEDLKGKRIGIKDYQQSIGLWTRGVLQMEFGVKPEDMIWYQGRGKNLSHSGASAEAGLNLPPSVNLNYAQTNLSSMMAKGELDAWVYRSGPSGIPGIDRVGADMSASSQLMYLFPNPREEAIRFFKKTGVYSPHHTTVVRESILNDYPWAAMSLMEAFEESKKIAMDRLRKVPPSLMVFGEQYINDIDAIFGLDPFPYGVKANAAAFDMAQTFSVQQGLTDKKQPLEEIFPIEVIYSDQRLS